MNNIDKETFTRTDIELSLKKEFPNLKKNERMFRIIQEMWVLAKRLYRFYQLRM